jgi:hypothetical protein
MLLDGELVDLAGEPPSTVTTIEQLDRSAARFAHGAAVGR